jgi:hypothetical protein
MFHDETHGAAALAASEAVAKLLGRRYRERRGFLVVERAQANEVCTTAAQTHKIAHNFYNVGGVENSIYGFLVYHALGPFSSTKVMDFLLIYDKKERYFINNVLKVVLVNHNEDIEMK